MSQITQTTINRINKVNDLELAFEQTLIDTGVLPETITKSTVYFDLAIQELLLDILKRDGE
jgi:hypothetical protein